MPILIDQTSPLSLLMATATQDNSLNQDMNEWTAVLVPRYLGGVGRRHRNLVNRRNPS
jgi:hypothetical protein